MAWCAPCVKEGERVLVAGGRHLDVRFRRDSRGRNVDLKLAQQEASMDSIQLFVLTLPCILLELLDHGEHAPVVARRRKMHPAHREDVESLLVCFRVASWRDPIGRRVPCCVQPCAAAP